MDIKNITIHSQANWEAFLYELAHSDDYYTAGIQEAAGMLFQKDFPRNFPEKGRVFCNCEDCDKNYARYKNPPKPKQDPFQAHRRTK